MVFSVSAVSELFGYCVCSLLMAEIGYRLAASAREFRLSIACGSDEMIIDALRRSFGMSF
jgi:hypothetical protein